MPAQPTDLERSILHTVCWFAVHGYPLTTFEIWKWLWFPVRSYQLEEILEVLETSPWLEQRFVLEDGFYALRGSETVPSLREWRDEKFIHAIRKYNALRRAANYFSLLPTVRLVAAGNTLAWWHTREESDLDLFIVSQPHALWLTRLLTALPFVLLRQRPGIQTQDPFCFSFFVSTDRLSLKDVQLFGGDPYLVYWIRSLVPVFDRGEMWKEFCEKNSWATECLPHATNRCLHPGLGKLQAHRKASGPFKKWENWARQLQFKRLPPQLRLAANQDTSVVITNEMLKFHDNDRREQFRDRFQELVTMYER